MDKQHEALSMFEARLHEQHIGFFFFFFFMWSSKACIFILPSSFPRLCISCLNSSTWFPSRVTGSLRDDWICYFMSEAHPPGFPSRGYWELEVNSYT